MNSRTLLYLVLAVAGLAVVVVAVDRAGRNPQPEHVHQHRPAAQEQASGAAGQGMAQSGAAGAAVGTVNTEHAGYALYKSKGCAQCHGVQLQGTRLAPALVDLSRFWDAMRLAEYLRDPEAMIHSDQRLAKLDEQYRMGMMPPSDLPPEEMQALVSFLLDPTP